MGFLHSARLKLKIGWVGEIGFSLGLINENLFSSFVILAIVFSYSWTCDCKVLLFKKKIRKVNISNIMVEEIVQINKSL